MNLKPSISNLLPRSYFRKQVLRAAKALDREQPGWEFKVKVDILNIGDHKCCVLGQLYGEYDLAPETVKKVSGFYFPKHGFLALLMNISDSILYNVEYRIYYPRLTESWRRLITTRLKKQSQQVA